MKSNPNCNFVTVYNSAFDMMLVKCVRVKNLHYIYFKNKLKSVLFFLTYKVSLYGTQ